ncbi:MAG: OsmC family protein [Gemmatimonadetes bacterium]|nr:OsmC family protein [Gemmatimonadota bacterium]
MATERYEFTNRSGVSLAGRLEMPETPPRFFALFAHCFTCSKDIAAASRVSRALAARGIAVLRFDFTGIGNSDGDFENTSFQSNVEDLVDAAGALEKTHEAPRLLIGHSLGGAAVIVAARGIEQARAVVTIGAPSDTEHLKELFGDSLDSIESEGCAYVDLAGRSFPISKSFVDDLANHTVTDEAKRLKKALLVLHSPIDQIVGIEHARRIFEATRHPKSFLSLDGADHLLNDRADSRFVADVVASWADRYAADPAGESQDDQPAPALAQGEVRVDELGPHYTQAITAGRHRILADEPLHVGGGDQGMTPYDLLLAALGTCTSMTLRLYADRKQWPLTGVSVSLQHGHVYANDCAECESSEGKVDRIERVLAVEGDLTEEQRARLLEIANKCPVHRTLLSETVIPTRMSE